VVAKLLSLAETQGADVGAVADVAVGVRALDAD
jgi:hypothetical protein